MSAAGGDDEVYGAFAASLPGRVEALTGALASARAPGAPPDAVAAGKQEAHRLYGTAGCFDFEEVAVAAGAIEDVLIACLDDARLPTAGEWERIDALLATLRASRPPAR